MGRDILKTGVSGSGVSTDPTKSSELAFGAPEGSEGWGCGRPVKRSRENLTSSESSLRLIGAENFAFGCNVPVSSRPSGVSSQVAISPGRIVAIGWSTRVAGCCRKSVP